MSNRLLSIIILVIFFGGISGVFYYFFVANTATVSFTVNGSGPATLELTSEFKNSYKKTCEKVCTFEKIPPVGYVLSAKRDGYVPLLQNIGIERGVSTIALKMEKEITLDTYKKKKEEIINTLRLKKAVWETMENSTGSVVLGYRSEWLYFAVPTDTGWLISLRNDRFTKKLFPLPQGVLGVQSLNIYEGYITLDRTGKTSFYKLPDGMETVFNFDRKIIRVKDTGDANIKIITGDTGVFIYTLSDKTARLNPLYDDIVLLPSGNIVALVKKSSKAKLSLLSLGTSGNDYVLLIWTDKRERKTLLETPKNGQSLLYRDFQVVFADETGEEFVLKNIN